MGFVGLGYVGAATTTLDRWVEFANDVLGMEVSEPTAEGIVRLRMDDHASRVALIPSDHDALDYVGWELSDEAAFRDVVAQIEKEGIAVEQVTGARARAERQVTAYAVFRDPAGNRVEVFYGPDLVLEPLVSKWGCRFVTGELGIGHIFAMVDNFEETRLFYERLGFRLSDWMEGGGFLFYRCNPRQHSLALGDTSAGLGIEAGVHHFMVQVEDMDAVGRAYDACLNGGWPVTASLGRHSNDRMFSFYVRTPSGFEMEYGWGGIEVDEATWVQREWLADSIWGHRPPVSEKEEAEAVAVGADG